MFTRDAENQLRFLDVRLSEWVWLTVWSLMWLAPFPAVLLAGMPLAHSLFYLVLFSMFAYFSIRLGYKSARSIGKPLDWSRLPKFLESQIKFKQMTKKEAIKLYDLFFYSVHPWIREWDLRSFVPLPPKEEYWFLESNN